LFHLFVVANRIKNILNPTTKMCLNSSKMRTKPCNDTTHAVITINKMALRRPPTRLELKADDIDEYTKVSSE